MIYQVVFFINLGEIQSHLQGMVNLIRDEDTMRLVSLLASHSSFSASSVASIVRLLVTVLQTTRFLEGSCTH